MPGLRKRPGATCQFGRPPFVEDPAESKKFYTEVFGLQMIWEDDVSAVVKLSNLIINLLQVSNAATLVEPIPVAAPGGSRALLTFEVDDANAGVRLLQRVYYLAVMERAPHFHLWLVPKKSEGGFPGVAYLAQRPPLTTSYSDAEAVSVKVRELLEQS